IIAVLALVAVVFIGKAQTGKTMAVIVAQHDLPEGYTITSGDVQEVELPVSNVPQGAFTDANELVGETLSVPRSAQDVILRSHLGGTSWELQPDERAIGIEVSDSAGLAGLLKPGDFVGVNAVIASSEGSFSKVVSDGLRVLYVSPTFLATAPKADNAEGEDAALGGGGGIDQPREDEGVVILAVPTGKCVIAYDFSAFGVESKTRTVNVIELLSAFDHSSKVALSLFMDPADWQSFLTSGVHVPDLVITPAPSPTPEPSLTPTPDWEA
ncbi:MAG: Flp pilus assembly protein CpaB, partial [Chloroflexota bacterium]|nr:Flp pilus assembly protein CpaB [Chloroflexota bacterium]